MANCIPCVYDRRMKPFRTVFPADLRTDFAVEVIGHRVAIPEPVAQASSPSWFCFLFHHPVVARTAAGTTVLPAESVLIVAPGEVIGHRPQGRVLVRSWVRCLGPAVAAALAESGLATSTAYSLGAGSDALAALLAMHRACVHPRGSAMAHRLALFRAWLHTVARDAASPSSATSNGIAEVRRHLDENHLLPQRLDDLATLADCSRAQLCRRFRRVVGCSPIQYVLRLRLEAACDLLHGTILSIPAIAEACGFSDRYHFSRAFSARYDSGPAAWRTHRSHDTERLGSAQNEAVRLGPAQ